MSKKRRPECTDWLRAISLQPKHATTDGTPPPEMSAGYNAATVAGLCRGWSQSFLKLYVIGGQPCDTALS